jgi:hypothetical protein
MNIINRLKAIICTEYFVAYIENAVKLPSNRLDQQAFFCPWIDVYIKVVFDRPNTNTTTARMD